MKYCSKCGKEIMDEAIICPGCGEKCNEQGASNPASVQQGNMNFGFNNSSNEKVDIEKTLLLVNYCCHFLFL